jgi:hypothetical protein
MVSDVKRQTVPGERWHAYQHGAGSGHVYQATLPPFPLLGQTDELGFGPLEDGVHVHGLQATVLHLLGLDHKRLTFRFQGRDFRLTDVHGEVVTKLLA